MGKMRSDSVRYLEIPSVFILIMPETGPFINQPLRLDLITKVREFSLKIIPKTSGSVWMKKVWETLSRIINGVYI